MVSASAAAARLSAAQSGCGGGPAGQAAGPQQEDTKKEQKPDQPEAPPVVQAPPNPNPEGRNVPPMTQTGPAVPPANAQVSAGPPRAAAALPAAPIPRLHTQAFWSGLDASADQLEEEGRTERKVEIAFAAGVVVSAGYFLLTARGVYLALSALLARPLWKQFDPLEVLFAWEQEKDRRLAQLASEEDEEEETLQTMVG
jgi:hypothetical protein